MSNNRLTLDGLEDLRAALRRLPVALREDATNIVLGAAKEAEADIDAGYAPHRRSGELEDKLSVETLHGGPAYAGAIVRDKSKLAFLFEIGTQGTARHTASGANRGPMPAEHVFIPVTIKRRREMYDKLRVMMRSHGLIVNT